MSIKLQISHMDTTPICDMENFDLPLPRLEEEFELDEESPTYVVCGVYHCFKERKVILWVRPYSEYSQMTMSGENPFEH